MSESLTFRAALRLAWPDHARFLKPALLASLTLGLAPYYPHAHVWKQLVNLARGTLTEPMDVFDLVLHGTPWVLLFVFGGRFLTDAVRRVRTAPPVQPETEVS